MAERSLDFADWIAEARAVSLGSVLERHRVRLKRSGTELVGPCPVCGGRDRFAVNLRKGVFVCRGSGEGGDSIALTRYLEACDFKLACQILTGRPPPGRESLETPEAQAERQAQLAKRAAREAKATEEKARDRERWRERERRWCWDAWQRAVPVPNTPAEQYLRRRGLLLAPSARLRCLLQHPLYAKQGDAQPVHVGPALVGAIVGPTGKFSGLHATWIDLAQPKGKALIADPETGELVPAKKVRGSAGGGHIALVRCDDPLDVVVGEGIETVLSAWRALSAKGWPHLERAVFWSAYSLDNIGGRALHSVPHPTLTTIDRRGHARRRMVKGPMPDLSAPGLVLPPTAQRLWLIGDGDSERFATECALERGARRARAANPNLEARAVWAPEGEDLNDALMEAAA
ncbi:DUF7146 domain-containing protein [Methylobacterium gnaphalii]|uniref:Uncharacterized protein n=1 Tax=Methylobacterium gnaphalii TaxID=1010610 RepID=A0A512JQQ7_9HYPH|nr:CHC2 zinc finger domain-containing protein [Methylobacterium gnaphalii]GEP12272.1 hypothetical protein MGN01_41170 [Methylobacterium gnaphalii]GJD68725.1 hypothetical protein MMMDOFMJ_1649 [Methylobacterium gnaphalii]GLS49379.1 hypothetical protein GCM10007885_22270 [Methylobacterium gnaphalii]